MVDTQDKKMFEVVIRGHAHERAFARVMTCHASTFLA
jgi:hypothetical protein